MSVAEDRQVVEYDLEGVHSDRRCDADGGAKASCLDLNAYPSALM